MSKRNLVIRIDNRTRLMSAVLAATTYPDTSQERQKHGTPLHARGTRKVVAEYAHHPAVQDLQFLLDKNTSLAAIFGYAVRLTWPELSGDETPRWVPPHWNEHLHHFYDVTKLADWWAEEDDTWQTAIRHLLDVFNKVDVYSFLCQFFGDLPEALVFVPNISYPTDTNVCFRVGAELCAIVPPRKAWGDSAPWPYDNDPGYVYQEALRSYEELLLADMLRQHTPSMTTLSEKPLPVGERFKARHPSWSEQLTALFTASSIALFLEQAIDTREAKAFVQMQQRTEDIPMLPGVIGILKRYLDENKAGKYENFAEYLPAFAKNLRVVKTFAAL